MSKKNKKGGSRQKSPRAQTGLQPPPRKGILRCAASLLSPTGLFWTSVSLIVTILSAYFLLRVQVSVEPDVSLDPSNPNATLFRITNQGVLKIYDFTRDVVDMSMRDASGNTIASGLQMVNWEPAVKELASTESTTITLPTYISPLGPQRAALNIRYKDCDVTISCAYRDFLGFSHHKSIRFQCIVGTDGLAHWYHEEAVK
jgi:hypothetical protein